MLERTGPPLAEPSSLRATPLDQLAELTEVHLRLLASNQELLEAYIEVFEELRRYGEAGGAGGEVAVTVDAGPFMSLGAVRAFEAALATLPGVIDVAVRGYERGNRAIVDVQLNRPRA